MSDQATEVDGRRAGVSLQDALASAAGLFRRQGYGTTTTRQIAAELGIRNASLYHHIESKDALLLEICLESLRRTRVAVEEAISGVSAPRDRLLNAARAHVATGFGDADMHATMLTEMRALPDEMRQRVLEQRAEYESFLRSLVADAQADGALRADRDAFSLTRVLLSLLNWPILIHRTGSADGPTDEFVDLTLDVYLNGAGSPSQKSKRRAVS